MDEPPDGLGGRRGWGGGCGLLPALNTSVSDLVLDEFSLLRFPRGTTLHRSNCTCLKKKRERKKTESEPLSPPHPVGTHVLLTSAATPSCPPGRPRETRAGEPSGQNQPKEAARTAEPPRTRFLGGGESILFWRQFGAVGQARPGITTCDGPSPQRIAVQPGRAQARTQSPQATGTAPSERLGRVPPRAWGTN